MMPLRILHTESSLELGGQEFRILNEANGMVRRGNFVVLAVQPHSQLAARAKERGICVEEVNMNRVRWVWLIFVFLKIIKKYNIHVVNTHGSIDSWTAAIAGRLSHKHPLIIRTRHKSTIISKTWRHRLLYKCLPHGVITTGEAVGRMVMEQANVPEAQVISIPTGVDLDIFHPHASDQPIVAETDICDPLIVIGTVTFFRSYKGLTFLLDAAKLVVEKHPKVTFTIVGDGPDFSSVRSRRDELGLREVVQLTGYRDDVRNVLANIDIFVLSSVAAEGVPQSLSQAMAMALPVIATDVGSVSEIVKHEETGLLVEAQNVDMLAQAIGRLIASSDLRNRLGQAGRKHIEQSYSFVHMLSHTETTYDALLRRQNVHSLN